MLSGTVAKKRVLRDFFFCFFGIPLCLRGGRGVAPSFSALGPMSPFVLLQRRGGEGEISMRTTDDFHPTSPRPNPVFPIGQSVSREPAVKVERRLRKQRKHTLKTLTFPQDFFSDKGRPRSVTHGPTHERAHTFLRASCVQGACARRRGRIAAHERSKKFKEEEERIRGRPATTPTKNKTTSPLLPRVVPSRPMASAEKAGANNMVEAGEHAHHLQQQQQQQQQQQPHEEETVISPPPPQRIFEHLVRNVFLFSFRESK